MHNHDARDILDWFWNRGLITGCCVYDGRSRWRDAYHHGNTHKARIRHNYYYCVDDGASPEDAPVPENGFVVTLGFDTTDAVSRDAHLLCELCSAIGATSIEPVKGNPDVFVVRFD